MDGEWFLVELLVNFLTLTFGTRTPGSKRTEPAWLKNVPRWVLNLVVAVFLWLAVVALLILGFYAVLWFQK